MWCANCSAEVAAEVSPESGRVQCAICQAELARVDATDDSTRDAREILARWAESDLMESADIPDPAVLESPVDIGEKIQSADQAALEAIGQARSVDEIQTAASELNTQVSDTESKVVQAAASVPDSRSVAEKIHDSSREALAESAEVLESAGQKSTRQILETNKSRTASASNTAAAALAVADVASRRRNKPKLRFDSGTQGVGTGGQPDAPRVRTRRPSRQLYYDEPHAGVPEPHFEYTLRPPESRPTNWSVLAGQWLAYGGVLALTIGTAIVVYGHFGGYSNYTPTGWLVTTVGQMLLFLGVINLVSGGMEQSNDEVNQRIEILGEHILRIEQATDHAMRGPRIPAEVYDGAAPESQSTKKTVRVDSADG